MKEEGNFLFPGLEMSIYEKRGFGYNNLNDWERMKTACFFAKTAMTRLFQHFVECYHQNVDGQFVD
jgi:hypothetical protein